MHLIPSHRDRPADDPIFSLHREATSRRQRGEEILDATIGVLLDDEGRLAVLPTAARALREVPPVEWASYAPIAGTPDFLRAVVADLLGAEPDLAASAVAVATPGGSGAVRHAAATFLEPGQSLLTTSWCWGPYQTICDEAGRGFSTFEMFTTGGALDVGALDAAVAAALATQKRALVVLNDPCHNPTGYSMTDDDWRGVVDCLSRRAAEGPVTLLLDCAYWLYGQGDPRVLARRVRPLLGRVAVLLAWSASKSFTHYGLRAGALVACIADPAERSAIERALIYACRGTWSNCNRGGMVAMTRLLADSEMARACSAERDEAKRMLLGRVEAFHRCAHGRGLRYPRYEGGFFVTVSEEHPQEKAATMRARGVYVVPQVEKGGGRAGALRVALCAVPERAVPRLVDALG